MDPPWRENFTFVTSKHLAFPINNNYMWNFSLVILQLHIWTQIFHFFTVNNMVCYYSQKTSVHPIKALVLFIMHELYMKQVMLICYPLSYIRLLYGPKSLDSLALPLVWQLYRPACRNLHLVMLSHSFQLNAGISGQWATLKTNYTALKSNISILWCYINTHC